MKQFVAAAALAVIATGAAATEVDVKQLAERCAACHGADGKTPIAPEYPILAGQHASYLEKALTEYKTKLRKNLVMTPQAEQLSPAEIEALARHFESLPSPLYTPSVEGQTR